MKSPLELSEERLKSLETKIANLNKRIENDATDGKAINDRDELVKLHEAEHENYLRLKEKEDLKAAKTQQQNKFPEQSKIENNSTNNSLRSETNTERLLEKMTIDKLIHTIEKNLSINHSEINILGKTVPQGFCYTFLYCRKQAEIYNESRNQIDDIEFDGYAENFRKISDIIKEQNSTVKALLPRNDSNPLLNRLDTLESFQKKLEVRLISYPNETFFLELKIQFCDLISAVKREFENLSIRAAQYNEN